MLPTANYWSILINILIQKYLANLTTTCILWHPNFEKILEPDTNYNVLLQINPINLTESFSKDIYNFTQQDEYFSGNLVYYNDFVKKYIAAISNTYCEGYVVFQDHIPLFAENFRKASLYSIWRSMYSRFIFVYVKDVQEEDYFRDIFFQNQASILVVEADFMNSSTFSLKTNKFVGSRSQHPEELFLLSTFDALDRTFSPDIDLFSTERLKDLQGREIIIASLDYRPFVAVDYEREPLFYDQAEDNPSHLVHVDGSETRVCHTFCEIYNCTVQFDTSEKEEWGSSYTNFTGTGLLGLVIGGKVDMTSGAMYAWSTYYMTTDVTQFLVRSGVTCLVPAPRRIVSWDLPLKPFKMTLWLVIMSVLVLESVSLLLARQFEQNIENPENHHKWKTSYMFGFISAFKLFLNQGTDYVVHGITLKVILLACYSLDIIITSVYGGGLASILTMPILEEAADSVERMYTHQLKWAATSYVWVESLKDVDDDPIIMGLLANFKTYKFEEVREMAKTENMGFAVERLAFGHFGNFDFITPESLNRLKLSVDDIYFGYTVAMVTRLWAHLPKYNDLVLAWHSSGFDKIWEWKITAEFLNVNEQNQIIASRYFNFDTGPVKLGMSNFGGMILLWILGMTVSTLVFAGEWLAYKIMQKKLKAQKEGRSIMFLTEYHHWSTIISLLIQNYFTNLTTTCVLASENFKFDFKTSIPILQINPLMLNESFDKDLYDFKAREERDKENNVFYNELIKKLIAAIEQTHCEGFLAFQDDIPRFAEAFAKASTYSIWRSVNSRFIFAFTKELQKQDYFQDLLFKNQANILVIESDFLNSSTFRLKTNKFVGPRSQQQDKMIYLSTFYALNRSFVPKINLLSAKLRNLQGRPLVMGAFDYRPFVAVDFKLLPQYYDHAADNPSHLVHVDGAEIRITHIFCELYNCTVEFDTTEKQEWGLAFKNYSGYGLIGNIIDGKIEMAMQAMYLVCSDYYAVDATAYIGRSGATCLVPAASLQASWYLPLRPFKFTLWLGVLACLFLEALSLFLARKFEQNLIHKKETWWSCLEFGYTTTLKIFINQSSDYLVHSHTLRTVLFCCYTMDIILTSVYGGGLSSVLTLPTFGETADSVEKMVKYNLSWMGSSYAWLETIAEEAEENSFYKSLIDNFILDSMDEMRSKAKTLNVGFILERMAFGHFGGGDYITPEALQRLKLMVDDIYNQFTVAMVSRLWVHLPKFNDLCLRWHSSGLDKFWEWKSTAKYLNINEQNQVAASKHLNIDLGPVKLNIQNFAGSIVLWIVGMLMSIGTFVVELVWFKFGKRA
ncbi:hypothetical protein FF38_01655 [Lucilia cuprina]|uniref:Ionotropic glutamate receptor C-terminal domain-containing protein n=1 Tax=Lucilia cuprina TaxID=7375 RepID=A0A0L0BRS9_LUCCU|nr:hypothetical protein FF38_01655 [Lucilia cuprina]